MLNFIRSIDPNIQRTSLVYFDTDENVHSFTLDQLYSKYYVRNFNEKSHDAVYILTKKATVLAVYFFFVEFN